MQLIAWKGSSLNDLLCVEWDVKPYTLTHLLVNKHSIAECDCQIVFRVQYTEFGVQHSFRVVYADIMYKVVTFILPFLVLTVFSILLIRVYRAHSRRRAAMLTPRGSRSNASTSSSTTTTVCDEHSVTRVIVVVMVVFAVCNLPGKVFDNAYRPRPDCGTLAYVARRLCFVLEVANSAANFIVYCALRHQFRDGLRRALSPLQAPLLCRRQQMDGVTSVSQRGLRQRARSASPAVDLELIQKVYEEPGSRLGVPGVLCDRYTT